MKIFLSIYIVSAILVVFLLACITSKCLCEFRKRNPTSCFPKTHWTIKVITCIRVIALAITPVLNSALAVIFVISFEEICDNTLKKAEERCGLR